MAAGGYFVSGRFGQRLHGIVVGGVVFVADNEVTGQGACVAEAAALALWAASKRKRHRSGGEKVRIGC